MLLSDHEEVYTLLVNSGDNLWEPPGLKSEKYLVFRSLILNKFGISTQIKHEKYCRPSDHGTCILIGGY